MDTFALKLSAGLALLSLVGLTACGGDSQPVLSSTSPFVDFGEVAVGGSVEAQVVISNLGTAGAEVPQPTLTGAHFIS